MTNQHMKKLIRDLEGADCKLWNRVGNDLNRSSRARRSVNISRIARNTKKDEVVVVPGKVLGSGEIAHSLTVAAWDFSTGAKTQIEAAKGKCISIGELFKQNPKGQKMRILG